MADLEENQEGMTEPAPPKPRNPNKKVKQPKMPRVGTAEAAQSTAEYENSIGSRPLTATMNVWGPAAWEASKLARQASAKAQKETAKAGEPIDVKEAAVEAHQHAADAAASDVGISSADSHEEALRAHQYAVDHAKSPSVQFAHQEAQAAHRQAMDTIADSMTPNELDDMAQASSGKSVSVKGKPGTAAYHNAMADEHGRLSAKLGDESDRAHEQEDSAAGLNHERSSFWHQKAAAAHRREANKKPIANVWSPQAREASILARQATRKANSEGAHAKNTPKWQDFKREDVQDTTPEAEAERLHDELAEHDKNNDRDKAIQAHRQLIAAHQDAADAHGQVGNDRAEELHRRAAHLHSKAAYALTHNGPEVVNQVSRLTANVWGPEAWQASLAARQASAAAGGKTTARSALVPKGAMAHAQHAMTYAREAQELQDPTLAAKHGLEANAPAFAIYDKAREAGDHEGADELLEAKSRRHNYAAEAHLAAAKEHDRMAGKSRDSTRAAAHRNAAAAHRNAATVHRQERDDLDAEREGPTHNQSVAIPASNARSNIMPTRNDATVGSFFGALLKAASQAHILHLKTRSFAQHMALDELYKELPGLVDSLVEAYQGRYGVVPDITYPSQEPPDDPIDFVRSLQALIAAKRDSVGADSELQNLVDEVTALVDATLYKLTTLNQRGSMANNDQPRHGNGQWLPKNGRVGTKQTQSSVADGFNTHQDLTARGGQNVSSSRHKSEFEEPEEEISEQDDYPGDAPAELIGPENQPGDDGRNLTTPSKDLPILDPTANPRRRMLPQYPDTVVGTRLKRNPVKDQDNPLGEPMPVDDHVANKRRKRIKHEDATTPTHHDIDKESDIVGGPLGGVAGGGVGSQGAGQGGAGGTQNARGKNPPQPEQPDEGSSPAQQAARSASARALVATEPAGDVRASGFGTKAIQDSYLGKHGQASHHHKNAADRLKAMAYEAKENGDEASSTQFAHAAQLHDKAADLHAQADSKVGAQGEQPIGNEANFASESQRKFMWSHDAAAEAHLAAAKKRSSDPDAANAHQDAADAHTRAANEHRDAGDELAPRNKSGKRTNNEETPVSNALVALQVNLTGETWNKTVSHQGDETLHPEDFAYVPDAKMPSTWKLRIDDAHHVGGALAAIGKGYRGQKVSIPAKDLPAVKRKIAAAWKKFHGKDEELPDILKSTENSEGSSVNTNRYEEQLALAHGWAAQAREATRNAYHATEAAGGGYTTVLATNAAQAVPEDITANAEQLEQEFKQAARAHKKAAQAHASLSVNKGDAHDLAKQAHKAAQASHKKAKQGFKTVRLGKDQKLGDNICPKCRGDMENGVCQDCGYREGTNNAKKGKKKAKKQEMDPDRDQDDDTEAGMDTDQDMEAENMGGACNDTSSPGAEMSEPSGGSSMPSSSTSPTMMSTTTNQSGTEGETHLNRDQMIEYLAANCGCEEEQVILNSLSDDALGSLYTKVMVANTAGSGFVQGSTAYRVNPVSGIWEKRELSANEKAQGSNADVIGEEGGEVQAGGEEDTDDHDYESDDFGFPDKAAKGAKAGTKGAVTGNKSLQGYIRGLPREVQIIVNRSLEMDKRAKEKMIRQLTANITDKGMKNRMVSRYSKMDLNELRDFVSSIPSPTVNAQETPEPVYFGAGLVDNLGQMGEGLEEDTLPLPTMTYGDE